MIDPIRFGDTSDAVMAVQMRLQALGYRITAINGAFDNDMLCAVTAFQRASGIFGEDGFVGPETWKKLRMTEE